MTIPVPATATAAAASVGRRSGQLPDDRHELDRHAAAFRTEGDRFGWLLLGRELTLCVRASQRSKLFAQRVNFSISIAPEGSGR